MDVQRIKSLNRERNKVFETKYDFLIPISLQPNIVYL